MVLIYLTVNNLILIFNLQQALAWKQLEAGTHTSDYIT